MIDLERVAATIDVPIQGDGSPARAYVTLETHQSNDRPTEPCTDRDIWRVVFGLDYGRHDSAPVGPAFERPKEASAFARLLNAGSSTEATEPEPTITADRPEGVTNGAPAHHTDDDLVTASRGATEAVATACEACGRPFTRSRHGRRTCSARCRKQISRGGPRGGNQQLSLAWQEEPAPSQNLTTAAAAEGRDELAAPIV